MSLRLGFGGDVAGCWKIAAASALLLLLSLNSFSLCSDEGCDVWINEEEEDPIFALLGSENKSKR